MRRYRAAAKKKQDDNLVVINNVIFLVFPRSKLVEEELLQKIVRVCAAQGNQLRQVDENDC